MFSVMSAMDDIFIRRRAVTDTTVDPSIVGRGINVQLDSPDIARKMERGAFGFSDALALVMQDHHAGEWWERFSEWPLSEFRTYAEGDGAMEESAKKQLEVGREVPEYHDLYGGEVAVVLIGKTPESFDDNWGNNYGHGAISPGTQINIFEIQYDGGWGWTTLNGSATVQA